VRVEDLAQRDALTLGPVECLIAGLQELHGLTQPWRVCSREDYALLKTECSSPLLWCACAFVQSTCLYSLLRTYCCPVSIQGWVVLVEHVKQPSHCSRSWSSVWRDHPQGFALIAGSVQAILVLEGPTNGVSADWSIRITSRIEHFFLKFCFDTSLRNALLQSFLTSAASSWDQSLHGPYDWCMSASCTGITASWIAMINKLRQCCVATLAEVVSVEKLSNYVLTAWGTIFVLTKKHAPVYPRFSTVRNVDHRPRSLRPASKYYCNLNMLSHVLQRFMEIIDSV